MTCRRPRKRARTRPPWHSGARAERREPKACPPSGGRRLPERRQRRVGNRHAGIVEPPAVSPFPPAMCQGGCVKVSRLIDQARLWRPHAQLPPALLFILEEGPAKRASQTSDAAASD